MSNKQHAILTNYLFDLTDDLEFIGFNIYVYKDEGIQVEVGEESDLGSWYYSKYGCKHLSDFLEDLQDVADFARDVKELIVKFKEEYNL